MTREKALVISRALDNIDGFESMMDSIEAAVRDAEDFCVISADFKDKLGNLMVNELQRLQKVLEDM